MSVSIVLYRVNQADTVEELSEVAQQMDKTQSINLYKTTEDLAIIFMNSSDPYSDSEAMPHKMLFGSYVEKQAGDIMINGFVATPEVRSVCDWINESGIHTAEGFFHLYNSLSEEALQALEDIGADSKEALFNGYVLPLTQFYFEALQHNNAIVICGE